MTSPSLTITLPEPLYIRLKQRAEEKQRSIEDEVLDVVATGVPLDDELPAYLAKAIMKLDELNDEELLQAAHTTLPKNISKRLQALHLKAQREGLTQKEKEEDETLLQESDKVMLIRAHAAALLKQRGHDISNLYEQR